HGNVGCVTVGVARIGSSLGSSPRQVSGGTRHGYFALSGATGRAVLENALIGEGLATANTTAAEITGMLSGMAALLRQYRSKADGSAVSQAENWSTHNCAESNLALYLFRLGKDMGKITIASYEQNGSTIDYKPLCRNCRQWVRQHFNVLDDFNAHT
ncbi:hypothetical protein, partial [Tropicimonas sp. IMCC6043]|uniref:hypothetical protein n=1 Tax=Tropicimonas sp. IMCC6043 TaxID=2510645 RepID=UPI001A93658B